ncbi:MAG TPA: S-layer protein [Verrucomicrobiales bacterium]|nr:S-layer protein [Verrucomicrobiales bacterium]
MTWSLFLWFFLCPLTLALGNLNAAAAGEQSPAPSFRNDILPILSKAGCNGGGCHGALAGKGGFRLSLFGYDPQADHASITREVLGRRIEPSDPARSLLLLKPTTAVKHKGGKRIDVASEDYQTLVKWIIAGAPGPSAKDATIVGLTVAPTESLAKPGQQLALTVTAKFSDGSERDVTRHTKFTSTDETVASVDGEGRVTVIGPGAGAITAWYSSQIVIARLTAPFAHELPAAVFAEAPRANFIDDLVLEQLQRLNLRPSPSASDATFVRRAFLDTIGRLPTPEETQAFVAEQGEEKFARLADRLLARDEYVDYWTYKWSDLLLVSGTKLRPEPLKAYYGWIREQVAANAPWDEFARGVVTAQGSAVDDGASNFYAIHQDPESMAENVSQAFLSLSINCAKCHNHPLEKWTNDQYYQFANLFARVRAKGWGGDPRNGDGQRTLYVEPAGDLIQPRTGKPQPPAPLDAEPLPMDDPGDRREVLAEWLTAPDNPYFTRAIVNRVWANFMGVGLVEPVDDLRASNPPSNEELMSALADHLIGQRHDLKQLMRLILTSQTYRRSSEPLPENRDDRRHFSRFYPRRLTAEVLSDAISDVTGVRDTYKEIQLSDGSTAKTEFYEEGTRALELFDSAVSSYFLSTFGRNQREITCECERSNQPSLVQVLHLSNGPTINDKLASDKGRVAKLLGDEPPPGELLDRAWLLCLGRPPTDSERGAFEPLLATADRQERRHVTEDLFWSLLTSREFLFQH